MQQRLGGCLGMFGFVTTCWILLAWICLYIESKSSYLKLRLFCHSRRDSEEVCVYRSRFHKTLLLGCYYPFVLVWVGWYYTVISTSNWNPNFLQIQKGWRWNTFSPKPWLHIIQSKLRVYIKYINHSATAKEKSEGKSYGIGSYPAGSRLLRGRFFWPFNGSSHAEPAWKNMKVK